MTFIINTFFSNCGILLDVLLFTDPKKGERSPKTLHNSSGNQMDSESVPLPADSGGSGLGYSDLRVV
jgi:hypothetical protein